MAEPNVESYGGLSVSAQASLQVEADSQEVRVDRLQSGSSRLRCRGLPNPLDDAKRSADSVAISQLAAVQSARPDALPHVQGDLAGC